MSFPLGNRHFAILRSGDESSDAIRPAVSHVRYNDVILYF